MSVQQISVFVESKPGHLSRVVDAFTQANVSVRGYSASDTGDYGIVRFVVDNPDRALQVLHDMNCAATKTLYVKDLDQAEKLLADQPVELLDQEDFLHMTANIA